MDIKEVHNINLEILKEFDRFCVKHNIKYRLDAGSLIGAIRHKGFIPWDDDVDVAIKRCEYEKLIEALKIDSFPDGFVFKRSLEFDTGGHFIDFIDRLYYVKKVYREKEKYQYKYDGMRKYMCLDIFILDNIEKKSTFITYTLYKIIYAMAMGHRYKGDNTKGNIFEKIIVSILGLIGRLLPMKIIYGLMEKLCTRYKNKDTDICFYSTYPMPYIGYETNSKDEDDIIYVDFENIKLPIIRKSHELLINLYGDYMTLPKEQERKPAHVETL